MNEENGRWSKFLNAPFCWACNTVPENWHICVNKGLTYLHIHLKSSFLRSISDEKRVDSKSRSPSPTDASNGFGYYTLSSVINQIDFPELPFRLLPMNSLFYRRVQKRSPGLRCISRWLLCDELKTCPTTFPRSHGVRKCVTCAGNGRIHCNLQPSFTFFPSEANKTHLFFFKKLFSRIDCYWINPARLFKQTVLTICKMFYYLRRCVPLYCLRFHKAAFLPFSNKLFT